jgi:hypothetical protein
MKAIKVVLIGLAGSLASGCATPKYNTLSYLSAELPEGTIQTSYNVSHPETEEVDGFVRASIGFYRPPADVSEMLEPGKIYRDVEVILQTPHCAFPILCIGRDSIFNVAKEDQSW